jgi:hypothetical protein
VEVCEGEEDRDGGRGLKRRFFLTAAGFFVPDELGDGLSTLPSCFLYTIISFSVRDKQRVTARVPVIDSGFTLSSLVFLLRISQFYVGVIMGVISHM